MPPSNPIEQNPVPAPTTNPQPTVGGSSQYDFITNPEPPKSSFMSGQNKIVKAGLFLGLLLLLLIAFIFVKNLLSGGGNTQELKNVVFAQTEIVHISQNALAQPTLSVDVTNATVTTKSSVTSSRSDLIGYMSANGKKVKAKELNLSIDTAADQQLTSSLSNASYNETFKTVMKEKLAKYKSALSLAYDKTKGKQGKKMLKDDYAQAVLLETQFN